ncbi:hypothetical protein [Flavobacterium sp. LB2P53]|uniref:hypothetical protein n=1 Tax=Flavobacterium sp. LB2P53 TaxID=2497481 RepID=UPI000F825823|nr:hypothetical protein [Flavobacterium sp. LB2P53]RTY71559.1 hypothetical protein EKL95_02330 [Flavobacterium sp. LB2P53]
MIATIYQNITKYQVTLVQKVTRYHVTIGQQVNHFNVSISQNVTRTVTTIFQLGEKGKAGIQGKSAYQSAIENGFVGLESEWLLSLVPTSVDGGYFY